jgi:hypothetical protein
MSREARLGAVGRQIAPHGRRRCHRLARAVTLAGPWKDGAGHHRISRGMRTRGVPPGDVNFVNSDGADVPRDELAVITEATEVQDGKEDAIRANVRRAFV